MCFARLGEIAGEYLRKGSKVYIEGRLQTRKWQDKEGHDRYSTEIVANEMQMLDSRGGGEAGDGAADAAERQGATAQSGRARRQRAAEPQSQGADRYDSSTSDFGDDIDDDIPF